MQSLSARTACSKTLPWALTSNRWAAAFGDSIEHAAVPQSAAEAVPALVARGVRRFRVEFLDEPADEIGRVVRAYRDLLAGALTGREVWTLLNAANRVGVTRGTLEERRNPLAIL